MVLSREKSVTTRTLFLAVACSLLAACMPRYDVTSPYSEGPSSDKKLYLCKKGRVCEATVISTYGSGSGDWTGDLDHDPLYLEPDNQGPDNKGVSIFWNLPANSDYMFCPDAGDGVFLKNPGRDDQFYDQHGDGNPTGPNKKCFDRFHWRDKNTQHDQSYQYQVIFRDSVRRYVIDPWIVNGK